MTTRSLDSNAVALNELAMVLNEQMYGNTDLTVEDYLKILAECMEPMPEAFGSTTAIIAVARFNEALELMCTTADGQTVTYRADKDASTGLYMTEVDGKRYCVDIHSETGQVTMFRAVKGFQTSNSPLYAVDSTKKLCIVTIDQYGLPVLKSVQTPVSSTFSSVTVTI